MLSTFFPLFLTLYFDRFIRLTMGYYLWFLRVFFCIHKNLINKGQNEKKTHNSYHYNCHWRLRTGYNFCFHGVQVKSLTCIFYLAFLYFDFNIVDIMNRLKRRVKLGIFIVHTCFLSKNTIIACWSVSFFLIWCKLIGIWPYSIMRDSIDKILWFHETFFYFYLLKGLLYEQEFLFTVLYNERWLLMYRFYLDDINWQVYKKTFWCL